MWGAVDPLSFISFWRNLAGREESTTDTASRDAFRYTEEERAILPPMILESVRTLPTHKGMSLPWPNRAVSRPPQQTNSHCRFTSLSPLFSLRSIRRLGEEQCY